MVVLGEVFGELEAREVAVREDAPHDAGVFEHDQVAVEGALRERPIALEQLGDAERPIGRGEELDDRVAASGVALVVGPQTTSDDGVQVGHAATLAVLRITENGVPRFAGLVRCKK